MAKENCAAMEPHFVRNYSAVQNQGTTELVEPTTEVLDKSEKPVKYARSNIG